MKTQRKKYISPEVSEQIWTYIWNNASASDTDEDLLTEYDFYSNCYINDNHLKFIKL